MKSYVFLVMSLSLAVFLSGCSDEKVMALPEKGKVMPVFTMISLSGEKISSKALFKDKVVVFNVWATWCPPCRDEMPDLIKLSEMLPKDKFLVVGLATDQMLQHVKDFVKEHHVSFPIYWDDGGKAIALDVLGVARYPETFVLNRKGVLVERVVGGFPWASPQIKVILEAIYNTGAVPTVQHKEIKKP
ncbi:MAG: TlpA disulfide reductase family protein [Mariprofundaceae bacterium]|nr:TlpA disulfide reductase family protein [Mariprofundaceae bacterium]